MTLQQEAPAQELADQRRPPRSDSRLEAEQLAEVGKVARSRPLYWIVPVLSMLTVSHRSTPFPLIPYPSLPLRSMALASCLGSSSPHTSGKVRRRWEPQQGELCGNIYRTESACSQSTALSTQRSRTRRCRRNTWSFPGQLEYLRREWRQRSNRPRRTCFRYMHFSLHCPSRRTPHTRGGRPW